VLLVDSLGRLTDAIDIGERTLDIARQSIVVGLALSGVAMVVAASGGFTPAAGAALQEIIDVAVILNALRSAREPMCSRYAIPPRRCRLPRSRLHMTTPTIPPDGFRHSAHDVAIREFPDREIPGEILEIPDAAGWRTGVALRTTFGGQDGMKKDTAFCTQAGKTVRMIPAHDCAQSDGQPPSMESAICVDMNHRCVAAKCAVTQVPTPLMALRLVRSGVAAPTDYATARCPECERETVHNVVAWAQAMCTECNSVRRWSELSKRS
jgi:hypothetical protein